MPWTNSSPEQLASVLADLGFTDGCMIEQAFKPFDIPDGMPKSRAIWDLLVLNSAASGGKSEDASPRFRSGT